MFLNKLYAKRNLWHFIKYSERPHSYPTDVSVVWFSCKVHVSFTSTTIKMVCAFSVLFGDLFS